MQQSQKIVYEIIRTNYSIIVQNTYQNIYILKSVTMLNIKKSSLLVFFFIIPLIIILIIFFEEITTFSTREVYISQKYQRYKSVTPCLEQEKTFCLCNISFSILRIPTYSSAKIDMLNGSVYIYAFLVENCVFWKYFLCLNKSSFLCLNLYQREKKFTFITMIMTQVITLDQSPRQFTEMCTCTIILYTNKFNFQTTPALW